MVFAAFEQEGFLLEQGGFGVEWVQVPCDCKRGGGQEVIGNAIWPRGFALFCMDYREHKLAMALHVANVDVGMVQLCWPAVVNSSNLR